MASIHKKIHKYSKILDNLHFSWDRSFHSWDFLRKQIRTSIWDRYSSHIRNIKTNIFSTQGTIQFFIDWHEHSKDTVQIIKDGYGRTSKILGNCKYASGSIVIDEPQESRIADIGSARTHLRNGYPDIWKLKDEAESECKQKIGEIMSVWNKIKSIISSELERNIETTNTHLVPRPSLFQNEREYPVSCYYEDAIPEIVNEIKMRLDSKIAASLELKFTFESAGSVESGDLTLRTLSFGEYGNKLCKIKETEYNEIKSRIERLLENLYLKDRVSKIIRLKDDLTMNEKRNEFFNKIDRLYDDIYYESKSLDIRGKCNLCPFRDF